MIVNDNLITLQMQATVAYYKIILQHRPERPAIILFNKLVLYSYKVYRLMLHWFSSN
jgi:hypothetical protein